MRRYNPQTKKLDPKTISRYFIGYCVGSRGSKFYYMSHTTKVIESNRAIYFKGDTNIIQGLREIVFKEHPVFIPMPIAYAPISGPVVDQHLAATTNDEPIEDVDPVALEVDLVTPDAVMDISLRRLERVHRPSISNDYIVYLQEHGYDVGDVSDPTTYKEAIVSPQSNFQINVIKDEMISMSQNKVWSLVDFPGGCRPIGCKWVFKTKCDAKGHVERYKTRLVAKGYIQQEGIDFKEAFSPVSTKDSLCIIMAIVTHLIWSCIR